jgi:transposase
METKKTSKKRRKYDADFKAEVLKMIDNGQSATQISQKLGLGENLIYRWKKERQKAEPKQADPGQADPVRLSERIAWLEKQLRQAETDRDILKKAVSIFSASL